MKLGKDGLVLQDIVEWNDGDYWIVATISSLGDNYTVMLDVYDRHDKKITDISGSFTKKEIENFEEEAIEKYEEKLLERSYCIWD